MKQDAFTANVLVSKQQQQQIECLAAYVSV